MRKIYIALMAFCLPLALLAQVTTSSLEGTVKSAAGKSLEGASISALHQPTGTSYTVVTKGDNGQFQIPNMRVGGPYLIKVSFVGFNSGTYEDIYLKLAEPFIINASLTESGSELQNIIVVGSGRNSVMNANRTGSTTNIGVRDINRMPTISRSINDMTRMTPQASSTSTGSIGGGNYRQNFVTVDGSDFNNTFGIGGNLPANGSPISLDALEEISVNVTPYDVKQSGFIGSAINAVTRSGTNNFSGSVYTFWRSEKQQGNKVGLNTPFINQPLSINTYGFRFGGPIIKNKLFFFLNAETGKTISPGQLRVAATPEKPFGSSPEVTRPTATELNGISDYLAKTYGYETGGYQGYDQESENTRIVARIDWNINAKHRFNVRYSQVESRSPSFVSTSRSPMTNYPFGVGRTDNNALWFKNSNYYQDGNFYSAAAELNSNIGKFANTLRATWTNQNDPRSSDSKVFPLVDILKDGTPFTTFGYEPFTFGNLRDVSTVSIVDYVTWSANKHNFTAGFQADFQSTRNGFQRFGTSYYTFRSWEDFIGGVKPLDYAITYSLTPGYEQAFPKMKFNQYSIYGQDEISLTNRFKLTLGLRLDLPTYPVIGEIKTHPLVAALTFDKGEKINTGTLPKQRILWSPRLGFNYDVLGNRTLQLRGGTGIFTGRVPTVWLVAQSGDAGLLQFTQTYQTPTADRNDPTKFVTPGPFNADPRAYLPATAPAAGTAIPSSVSSIAEDFRFPQTWKSSLAVDGKLPWGLVGTLEGIVNKDLNVALGRNPNMVAAPSMAIPGYPDTRLLYPTSNTAKFINPLTSAGLASPTGTSAFNPAVLDNAKGGYYFSLAAKVEKTFSAGLSATVAYVYSDAKNLYDGNGDQLLNTWSLNQTVNSGNNPALSPANFVVPHRFIFSLTYRKEYLKHLATQVSMFYEGSIAGRFSYTYSADFNRDGQTNDLIYVPLNASQITFSDFNYGTTAAPNIYTAKQQSELFFKYVEQDPYLNSRKGQYAERNGAKMPWRNQIDVRFAQDVFANIGKKRNTIQFTLDIFNFANLLNKNWGIQKTINASAILVPTNVNSLTPTGTTVPTFRLQTDRGAPVTATYRDNNSISSTYYMQFGLRYIFN